MERGLCRQRHCSRHHRPRPAPLHRRQHQRRELRVQGAQRAYDAETAHCQLLIRAEADLIPHSSCFIGGKNRGDFLIAGAMGWKKDWRPGCPWEGSRFRRL